MNTLDSSTRELFQLRLKLADHLAFSPRRYAKRVYYHLEDSSRSRFFRLGYPEYVFVSLLDGSGTVAEAIALTAQSLGREALSEPRAIEICHWLVSEDLVTKSTDSLLLRQEGSNPSPGSSVQVSPFFTRIPLCSPDAFLKRLVPSLGWLYHPAALVAWMFLLLYAAMSVFSNWSRVVSSAPNVFNATSWLWLIVSWIILKLLHELSHGLACRRFGGRVGSMGLVLILLMPLPYIDVTSSWKFRSKWKRMIVASAGMVIEGWVAGIAAIWWVHTRSEVLSALLYNSIVVSGIATLAFNGNPFVRSDGYYLLTDLWEIPNLASRGSANLQRLSLSWIFGISTAPPNDLSWRNRVATGYAILSLLWGLSISAGLIFAASIMWHGAGIVFALVGLFIWGLRPLQQLMFFLLSPAVCRPIPLLRAAMISGCVSLAIWGIFARVPWPASYQSPGIVEFTEFARVRAGASGFVRQIHVTDGQHVEVDELLVELQNDDLEVECRDLKLAVEHADARCRVARYNGQIGLVQIEEASRRGFQQQLAERLAQSNHLMVRAPKRGRIIARELATIRDTFVEEGTEILSIGDESHKEMQFSISQEDVSAFEQQQLVSVRLTDGSRLTAQLQSISPRGSFKPHHLALCASTDGPLPVVQRITPSNSDEQSSELQFPDPRFLGICTLPTSSSVKLAAGSRGVVYPFSGYRTIGEGLWNHLVRTFDTLCRQRDAG